jgi:hypothetical protein
MRLPGFSAEISLYKNSRHYRTTGIFGQTDESVYHVRSISDLVKSPLTLRHHTASSLIDFIYSDVLTPISVRRCCQDCLSSFPCADESCRRQRLFDCSRKCNAEVIGGCGCPPGRAVCEGHCCRPGEVCTLTGCSPPNQVCNNRGGCLGRCLPEGCCQPPRIVCNNRCCAFGVRACASDGNCVGCGDEGQPLCGMTCRGDLHLNIDMLSNRLLCTAFCGHYHQHACRTTYRVPGGVRSRYRCFNHSRLFATGPANPPNCLCVPNTINDRENDVSDDSGFCISTFPAPGDIADPPDCDGPDCTSKHEG